MDIDIDLKFRQLFSQFGKLERMFFRRTSASYMEAICIFRDNVNAFIAQRLLDGYTLTEPNVVLDIKFLQEKEDEEEVLECNTFGINFLERTIKKLILVFTVNMKSQLLTRSSKHLEDSVVQR